MVERRGRCGEKVWRGQDYIFFDEYSEGSVNINILGE
jgi:hypothetical protein